MASNHGHRSIVRYSIAHVPVRVKSVRDNAWAYLNSNIACSVRASICRYNPLHILSGSSTTYWVDRRRLAAGPLAVRLARIQRQARITRRHGVGRYDRPQRLCSGRLSGTRPPRIRQVGVVGHPQSRHTPGIAPCITHAGPQGLKALPTPPTFTALTWATFADRGPAASCQRKPVVRSLTASEAPAAAMRR